MKLSQMQNILRIYNNIFIYFRILFLELIKQLNSATEFESLGEKYLIPYFDDLELVYSYGRIILQYNLNLQRNIYIAQVQNGVFSHYSLLFTNIPSEPFFSLIEFELYTCKMGYVEEIPIIRIGYIAGEIHPDFFNSLMQSMDTILLNTHQARTRIILYKAIGDSVDKQFEDIMKNNVEIAVLYFGKKVLRNLLKDKDIIPYIFAIGYETGQYCHPHVFHVSLTPQSQISYFIIPKIQRNFVLVCSNDEYGKEACEYSCKQYESNCKEILYVSESNDITYYNQKLDKYEVQIKAKNISIITLMADINKNNFMKYCESKSFTSDNVFMIDFSYQDYINSNKEGIKWEGYSTVQFHLYQPTTWRTSFLYQYYHQLESLGYSVLSMIVNFYNSIQSKSIKEFQILPTSFSFSSNNNVRIRFNKQLYAIYTLKSAVTVDPSLNDGLIWKISDIAITRSQKPFIAVGRETEICDYSVGKAEDGYRVTKDVYHILSLVNNIKHPYYNPLYSMFITAYTEEKNTSLEYESVLISLESTNLNNSIEIIRHYYIDHIVGFVIGYHNKSILTALNPVLEEYNGMFYSISQWDGNDCNPHIYHFGALTSQYFTTTLYDFFQKGYNYFAYVTSNVPDEDSIADSFNNTIETYCANPIKPIMYNTNLMSVDDILQDLIDKESTVTQNLVVYLNLNDEYLFKLHNSSLFKQFSAIKKYIIVNVNSRLLFLLHNNNYLNYTYNLVTILPIHDLENVKQNILKLLPYFDDFTNYPVYDVVVMSNIFKMYSYFGQTLLGVNLPEDYIIHQVVVLDSVVGDIKFSVSNQLQYPLYVYKMNDDKEIEILTNSALPQNPLIMINYTHMCAGEGSDLIDRKDTFQYIGLIISTNSRYNKISYQMKRLIHFISEFLYEVGRSAVYYIPILQDEETKSIEDIVQYYIDYDVKHVFTFISDSKTKKLMQLVEEKKKFMLWSFGIPIYTDACYSYVVEGFSIETLVNGILKSPIWSSRENCVLLYSTQTSVIADVIKSATAAYPIELFSYESNNTEQFYNQFMKDVLINLPNGGSILVITIPVEHQLFITTYNKYVSKDKRSKYKVYFSFTENFIGNKNEIYDDTYGIVTSDYSKTTESSIVISNIYNYYYSISTEMTFLESGLANSLVAFYDVTNRYHTYDIDIIRKNLISTYDLPSGHCSINKQFVISTTFNILYRTSYYNLSIVYTYERNSSENQENTVFDNVCNFEDPDNPVIETKDYYYVSVFCSLTDVNVRVAIESGIYISIDEINNEHGGVYGKVIKPYYRLFDENESDDFLNAEWFKKCKILIVLGEPVVLFFKDKLKSLNKVMFNIGTNIEDNSSNNYMYSFHWTMSSFILTLVSWMINNNNNNNKAFGIIYNDSIYSHSLVKSIASELEYKHTKISFRYKIVISDSTDYTPVAKRLCELIEYDSIIINALDNYEYTPLFNSITKQCRSKMHFTVISNCGVGVYGNPEESEVFTHIIATPFNLYNLSKDTQRLLSLYNDLYNNKMDINPYFYYSYLAMEMLHKAADSNIDIVDFVTSKRYNGMKLPLPTGEMITLTKCPKFPNYLYLYEYKYEGEYILHYASPSYYMNYPTSPREKLICDCYGEYKTYKIGILASNLNTYSSLDSMAEGAIAGIIELFQGKIINGYAIGYELYSPIDTDCDEAMNYFNKMGIQYIIGGDTNDCINKAIPALKKNNQYLFVPYILGGTICNEHVIFTSIVPNQYLQFFLVYFEMNNTVPCMHIIYEAEYEYLKYVVDNLQYMANQSQFDSDIFPLYFNNTKNLFNSIVKYSNDHCSLVYIPGIESYSMEQFLSTIYNSPVEPSTKKVYIILAKEIDLLKYDKKYTNHIYLITGYNYKDSSPTNQNFAKSLYQYLAIDRSSNVMANAYTAVKLLYDGIELSKSFNPSKIFYHLSYTQDDTPSGITHIADNNYIFKSFKLGYILNSEIDYIIEHKFSLKPETWILAYPNASICVISHDDHKETILRSKQITILLIYDKSLDETLKVQFYYFIKFFNSEYEIINKTYILAPIYHVIDSSNTCQKFVNNFKAFNYNKYAAIFLAVKPECKDIIEESNIFSNIKDSMILTVHYNEEFRCSKNMISHGLVYSRYISYEVQLLISVAHTNKVIFLASKENEYAYRYARDHFTTYGMSNYGFYIVNNNTYLDEVLIDLYEKGEDIYLAINLNPVMMDYLLTNANWLNLKELILAYFSFIPTTKIYDFSPIYYVTLSDPEDLYLSYINDALQNIVDFDVIPDYATSIFRLLSSWIAIVNRFKTFRFSIINENLYSNYFVDGLGSFKVGYDNYILSDPVFKLRKIIDSEDIVTVIMKYKNESPFTYVQDRGFNKTSPTLNQTQYFTICNVTTNEEYKLEVVVVAFLATLNTNTLSMLLTLIMLIEEANMNQFSYYLIPLVYDDEDDDEKHIKYLQKIIANPNIVVLFSGYDPKKLSLDVQYIKNTDMLYFYPGYYTENYCLSNLVLVGVNPLSLVYNVYLELIDDGRYIYLLGDRSEISINLLEQFTTLFSGVGLHYNTIDYDGDDYDTNLIKMKDYCDTNECVIVFCLTSANLHAYTELYDVGLKFGNGIDMYTFFLTENDFIDNRYIIENVTVMGTYFSGLVNTSFDFITTADRKFPNTLISRSAGYFTTNYRTEGLYIGFKIWITAAMKSSSFEPQQVQKLLNNREYESPSGTVYLGIDNTLSRRTFSAKVTKDRYFNVYHYSSLSNVQAVYNPQYKCNISQANATEILKTLVIGYIADFSERYRYMSQMDVLLMQQLLYDYNELDAFNGYALLLEVVSLNNEIQNNKDSDLGLIKELLERRDLVAVFGANSEYSFSLIEPEIEDHNILLYTAVSLPENAICDDHVFQLQQTILQKLPVVYSYMNISNLNTLYIIGKVMNNRFINQTIEGMIKTFSEKYNITTYQNRIPDEDLDNVDKFINNFVRKIKKLGDTNYAIFCTFTNDNLVNFISQYRMYDIKAIRNQLILAFYQEYFFNNSDLTYLSGTLVVRPYISDETVATSLSFESYLANRLSAKISLSLAYTYTHFTGFATAIQMALEGMKEDDITDDWPSFEYLKRATQKLDFETPLGKLEGSDYNSFITPTSVSVILDDGTLSRVCPQISSLIDPLIPNEKGTGKCDISTPNELYKYSPGLKYGLITLIVLICFILLLYMIFIFKNRKVKTIKFTSPQFLQFINIMGIITIIIAACVRFETFSQLDCTLLYGLLFQSVIMFTSGLVLKVWRVHAFLTNKQLKKVSVTDSQIFIRVFIISLIHAIVIIIWGLSDPFVDYSEPVYSAKTTYIQTYVSNKCMFNTYYVIFEFVVITILLCIGVYFSWTTRTLTDDFNESRSLATSIGSEFACAVLIIVVEILVYEEPDALLFLELGGITITLFVVCSVMILPKVWAIYVLHQISKATSKSGRSGRKKTSPMNMPNNDNKVTPAPPPITSPELEATRNVIETEVTRFNDKSGYSKFTRPSASGVAGYQYVRYEANNIPMIAENDSLNEN